jgi:hypothetical protein
MPTIAATLTATAEKTFRMVAQHFSEWRHDPCAADGCGQIVRVRKGTHRTSARCPTHDAMYLQDQRAKQRDRKRRYRKNREIP